MPPSDPIQFRRDHASTYSETDLDEIIKAVGELPPGPVRHASAHSGRLNIDKDAPLWDRRQELQSLLNRVAYFHKTVAPLEDAVRLAESPQRLHSRYQRLLRAISKFSGALADASVDILPGLDGHRLIGSIDDPPAPPEPDWLQLRCILAQAHAWAEWQSEANRPEPSGHGGKRPKPFTQLDSTIAYLDLIYDHVLERAPGFSTDEKQVCGPFLRYLVACLRPLLGNEIPSPDALRANWRRLNSAMAGST